MDPLEIFKGAAANNLSFKRQNNKQRRARLNGAPARRCLLFCLLTDRLLARAVPCYISPELGCGQLHE